MQNGKRQQQIINKTYQVQEPSITTEEENTA